MPHANMLPQPSDPPSEMVADISARLGRVCQGYSSEEFGDLVRQIAAVRAKYDAMRAEAFFASARNLAAAERLTSRRPPDDLIGDEAR